MTETASPQNPRRGVTGKHTTRGVPHGATTISPYIGVSDVTAAVEFYRSVFAARVVELTRAADAVIHAHLDLGGGHLHLERPDPVAGLAGPPTDGTASFALGYYCQDVDDVLTRALARGAEQLAPIVDFPSGDRFGAVRDPFGIRWSIMSRVEDLSEQEAAERVAVWANSRA